MSRKTQIRTESKPGQNINKWGKPGSQQVKLPSGTKLIFGEDELGILVFLGKKDISSKCIDAETGMPYEEGSILKLMFHDGKRIVSVPMSSSMADYEFEEDHFYYIHNAGEFRTKPQFNPFKDFEIAELGAEGEMANVDPAVVGANTLELTLANIAELNYNRLNYPLRTNVMPKADKK
jgi:hypothetical protein